MGACGIVCLKAALLKNRGRLLSDDMRRVIHSSESRESAAWPLDDAAFPRSFAILLSMTKNRRLTLSRHEDRPGRDDRCFIITTSGRGYVPTAMRSTAVQSEVRA